MQSRVQLLIRIGEKVEVLKETENNIMLNTQTQKQGSSQADALRRNLRSFKYLLLTAKWNSVMPELQHTHTQSKILDRAQIFIPNMDTHSHSLRIALSWLTSFCKCLCCCEFSQQSTKMKRRNKKHTKFLVVDLQVICSSCVVAGAVTVLPLISVKGNCRNTLIGTVYVFNSSFFLSLQQFYSIYGSSPPKNRCQDLWFFRRYIKSK